MDVLWLKYLHLIAFVYWLGGDLGTFFASSQVTRRDIGPQARTVALKIMLACDMGPKLAMPLIVALGFHLAASLGYLELSGRELAGVWVLTALWLVNVAIIHFREGTPLAKGVARFDLAFRIVVAGALAAFGIWGLASGQLAYGWIGWKILVFASLVACGIVIRLKLRPFGPAFLAMMTGGADEETDRVIERTVRGCRPYVWVIWGGLFLNAALGLHLI